MASCITPQWSNQYTPQARLTVTETESTPTNVTLSWSLDYVGHGYSASTNGVPRNYKVNIDGAAVKTGTFNINGISNTRNIASGTKVINKSNSARSISFSVEFEFVLTWSGKYSGWQSASGNLSIPAKTSYTITFNANGGSGAPGKQTKWHGTDITLSDAKPVKAGHSFQGWSTSNDSSVEYVSGSVFGLNRNTKLYAVWKANTYPVTYNANGGSGAPGKQTKTYGVTLKLSTAKPTRKNYNFMNWGTSPSSTTAAYAPGANYTANAPLTLYAIWQLAYTAPRISNLTADRCTSNGTYSEEGTYAKVKFDWTTDKTVTSIKIRWGNSEAAVTASGTKGTVEKIVNGAFDAETTYTITAYVADSVGNSTKAITLPPMKFLIDFSPNGVAIGKPSSLPNVFDIGYSVFFSYEAYFKKYGNGLNYSVNGGEFIVTTLSDGSTFNIVYRKDGQSSWSDNFISINHSKRNINFSGSGGIYFNNDVGIKKKVHIDGSVELNANAQIVKTHNGTSWIKGRDVAAIRNKGQSKDGFCAIASQKTVSGDWSIGTLYDDLYFVYTKDTDYNAGKNNVVNIPFTPKGGANFKDLVTCGGQGALIGNGGKLNFHSGARVYSNASQALFLAASGESGYVVKLGVTSGAWRFHPNVNGNVQLGGPSNRWGPIYSTTSTITTSDRNQKKDIATISDKYADFFGLLKPCSYKFIDGTSDRTHVGFIAQDVEAAMSESGLTALDFAGFCKDQEVKEVEKTRKVVKRNLLTGEDETYEEAYFDYEPIPDKYTYSLRYEEFIAINTAMIQKLMDKVATLEEIIKNGNKSIERQNDCRN